MLLGVVLFWIWISVSFVRYDEHMRDDVNLYKDDEYCRAHAIKSKLMALQNLAKSDPIAAGNTDLATYLQKKGMRRTSK